MIFFSPRDSTRAYIFLLLLIPTVAPLHQGTRINIFICLVEFVRFASFLEGAGAHPNTCAHTHKQNTRTSITDLSYFPARPSVHVYTYASTQIFFFGRIQKITVNPTFLSSPKLLFFFFYHYRFTLVESQEALRISLTMTENAWITEALVQFSKSPLWRTPVHNFIDDNCCQFNTEDEMKLEYTEAHNNFRRLVDSLLTDFVGELGVSLEDAIKALDASVASSTNSVDQKPAQRLLKYLLSVDDFESFYLMMVKRNLELDILASTALRDQGIAVDIPDINQAFFHASSAKYNQGNATSAISVLEANGDMDEEQAIRLAIQASLQTEEGMDRKAMVYEDTCLKEDLVHSVQKEQNKADAAKSKVEKEVQQIATQDLRSAEQYRTQCLSAIEEQKAHNIEQLSNKTLEAREANVRRHAERQKACLREGDAAPPAQTTAPTATTPPASAAVVAVPQPHQPPPAKQFGLSALPPIAQPPLPAIESKVKNEVAPTSAPAPKKQPAAAAPPVVAQPTKEELEERARHMREQRERILAMNKANRQTELTSYANQVNPGTATPAAPVSKAAEKDLTVEIARRLREDLLGEARRSRQ